MSFKPDPSFFAQLRRDPAVRAQLAAAARSAQGYAQSLASQANAPWMSRKGAGATIAVQVDGEHVRLVNTDHGGHLMEWGSSKNPPHAPLRRGVRAAGIRLKEHGK